MPDVAFFAGALAITFLLSRVWKKAFHKNPHRCECSALTRRRSQSAKRLSRSPFAPYFSHTPI